ncbi:MAG: prepilin-type N-terminal cleavage/methylation domain-containing protein [Planctomycetia bacterium]|nr:prepilin-type N-terminal cleavage/methylation domain-containing protein [Planctomycetia bacterium]
MMNDEWGVQNRPGSQAFIIHHSSFIISSSVPPCLRGESSSRRGFTLIEILVAMAVTLIMLGLVITIFALVTDSVSASRAGMEMSDQLRSCKHRLQLDLAGITVQMLPPRSPEADEGYFEYIEGPVGRLLPNTKQVMDERSSAAFTGPDTTVGDNDDMVMFTTRSRDAPFLGRFCDRASFNTLYNYPSPPAYSPIQSQVAEVVWFLRGTTLYRRVLLVRPDVNRLWAPEPWQDTNGNGTADPGEYADLNGNGAYDNVDIRLPYSSPPPGPGGTPSTYYLQNDISAHAVGGTADLGPAPTQRIIANSLGDLTKRENRFAHPPINSSAPSPYGFPHDVRGWGIYYTNTPFYTALYGSGSPLSYPSQGRLGLPTLRESCCNLNSPPVQPFPQLGTVIPQIGLRVGTLGTSASPGPESFDAWTSPNPWDDVDPATGTLFVYFDPKSTRLSEDVILTNVLAFDVRVWDPTAPLLLRVRDLSQSFSGSNPRGDYVMPGDPAYYAALVYFGSTTKNPTNPLLTNDDKVEQVGQGAYVDLNFANQMGISAFSGPGDARSRLSGGTYTASVYDTWSTHYEQDGVDQGNWDPSLSPAQLTDEGTDGFDNNSNNVIDEGGEPFVDSDGSGTWGGGMNPEPFTDLNGNGTWDGGEQETAPPYRVPLRGVQIKIRCFEPDSRQIREVTIVQEFVPE